MLEEKKDCQTDDSQESHSEDLISDSQTEKSEQDVNEQLWRELEILKNKFKEQQEEKELLLKRLQRAQADFKNYKQRIEKSRFQDRVLAQEETVLKLLPILDNFERALDYKKDSQDDNYAQGVAMIYRQLRSTLEEIGLKEIKALGEQFDPEFHEAVERVDDCEAKNDTVLEVVQKGYVFGSNLLRPALVKVSKGGEIDE